MITKIKKMPLLIAAFALCLLAAIAGITGMGSQTASAAYETTYDSAYSFYFENYDAEYDISSNRHISVTEKLTVVYNGTMNTGFIKTIPINGGELVRNVEAYEISNGKQIAVDYTVYTEYGDDVEYFCIDIGDSSRKSGTTHVYLIKYDYNLTKAQEGADCLYLNVIGVDRSVNNVIENASVTLLLPDGYTNGECFVGKLGSETAKNFVTTEENGRTVLSLTNLSLAYNEGVTFKMNFTSGSLSTYFEFTPFIFVIVAVILLVVMLVLRMLLFNKHPLTPVVNFEAPNSMDPLLMGKFIDNKVNSEDITAMIFYWADKGYLKINLDNQDDPTLIRIVRGLPASSPDYEQLMFSQLFGNRDAVRPSELRNRFYSTVEQVTARVNQRAKGLYDSKSIGISVIFALLGGALLGIAPLLLGILQINAGFLYYYAFLALLPALIIYGVAETVKYYSLKLTSKKKLLLLSGIVLLCAVFTALYVWLVPSYLMGWLSKLLLCVITCAEIGGSVLIISRTKEYTQTLNQIVGFRNFILLAEKERLEALIEEDPQFYYHILPYAQVLNVSDKWEDKFKDITVQPPQWMTTSMVGTAIRFHIINSIIRNSMVRMGSHMVARPASTGAGGSGRGGFSGGGHVGGGHGGGGFRGR